MTVNIETHGPKNRFWVKIMTHFIVPAGLVSAAIVGLAGGLTFVGAAVKVSDARDEAVHILRERCVVSLTGEKYPVVVSVPFGNARGVWIEPPAVRTNSNGNRVIVGDIMWLEERSVKIADAEEVELVRCDL